MANVADPIVEWLQVLDELTYYELLGITPGASADDVRAAFHVFCDTFHPRRISSSPTPRCVATTTRRSPQALATVRRASASRRTRAHRRARRPGRPS